MVSEVAWGDGTGDKIYLTYSASEGNQTVSVSSDANTGAARLKTVSFSTGGITQVLTVSQEAGTATPVFYDKLVFDGKAWILTSLVIPTDGSIRCTEGGETRKSQNLWFTARNTGEGSIRLYWGGSTNANRLQPMPFYRSTSYLFNNRYFNTTGTERGVFQTCKRAGFNSTSYSYTKGTLPAPNPLYIGGLSGSTVPSFTGYMRTLYIYDDSTQNETTYEGFDNYTPTYTLRPCTYRGAAGYWCVETSTFFGNSAETGTLSVAND